MRQDFHTPILFLIFNRPDTTQQVFNAIRKIKPKALYVAADGPRSNKLGDAEDCLATRAILKQVDWECEVHTLYRVANLGCRVAVSSAIDWFFNNVEEGIILEDDCLPNESFFWFCQELLEKYRNDKRVMHIGGSNFQLGQQRGGASYYFSRLAHVWGWASWRRAWKHYDVKMASFPDFLEKNKIADVFKDKKVQAHWIKNLSTIYKGANTWDYQWAYANLMNGGYCIIPNENLISNIGFGIKSTNTIDSEDKLANMPVKELGTIVHPDNFQYDEAADQFTNTKMFPPPTLKKRIAAKLKRTFYS